MFKCTEKVAWMEELSVPANPIVRLIYTRKDKVPSRGHNCYYHSMCNARFKTL